MSMKTIHFPMRLLENSFFKAIASVDKNWTHWFLQQHKDLISHGYDIGLDSRVNIFHNLMKLYKDRGDQVQTPQILYVS